MNPTADDFPNPIVPPTTAPAPRFGTGRALQTVISVGVLVATLFTLWTPGNLFNGTLAQKMALALQPTQTALAPSGQATGTPAPAAEVRIGLVAGHWGNDSGTVCKDGLTEADVNLKIATLVKNELVAQGYTVDLLQEFDKRLELYQATVLVSIHNDSCDYINDQATGFKVAAALNSPNPAESSRLVGCLTERYSKTTGLLFHYNSITPDMTQYHAYNEINSTTTAAVIETGFLNLDRQILTDHTDTIAKGVTEGILCYIRHETVEPTPTPTVQP